ncbi:MAG: hypothetical protein JSV36_12115 [Anaerolineae bacterium]|nr:MAG: hypothetical protein JSV36_12115 [Anaerolineae bacterium]
MKTRHIVSIFLLSLLVTACHVSTPAPEETPEATALSKASPTIAVTAFPEATPTPEPPAVTPSLAVTPVVEIEPTATPSPENEGQVNMGDLAIGQPGHYVNVTFGYQLRYPSNWYTGFGNRPLLVSFSNLDPGTHNRLSTRAEGCLIEVRASTNVYGLTLGDVRGQLPRTFRDAEELDLGGVPALRVRRSSEESPFASEVVYVDHADRSFVLSFEYARGATEVCRPAWEDFLQTWQWFEPEFAVYRNPSYGYAISHPRRWYRFNPRERGISISSQDPAELTDLTAFLMQGTMLIQTDVFDNPEMLPLKEWLAAQDWPVDLTNDIPIQGLIGVRVLREGPTPEIQEMSGYFQGPLGKVYEVICLYPAGQQGEFRPIANAILYSFSF